MHSIRDHIRNRENGGDLVLNVSRNIMTKENGRFIKVGCLT
jgi:hypothetical protein